MARRKITRDEALSALDAEYWAEVRSLAKEAIKEHPEDEGARSEWVHETCDGHEWVIYTYKARVLLICTNHPDAYADEMGEPAPTVEAAAYMALRHDVMEQIDAELSA